MILLFTILFNSLNALSDGLYDEGRKALSGVLKFLYIAPIIIICLLTLNGNNWITDTSKDFISVAISFLLVRYFLYDPVYNLTRGLNIFYIGNTKIYDKVHRIIFYWIGLPFAYIVNFFGNIIKWRNLFKIYDKIIFEGQVQMLSFIIMITLKMVAGFLGIIFLL